MLLSSACTSNVRCHHPLVTPPYLSRTGRDLLETRGNWLEEERESRNRSVNAGLPARILAGFDKTRALQEIQTGSSRQ